MKVLFRIVLAMLASLSAAVLLFVGVAYAYNRYFVEYEYQMVGWPKADDFQPPAKWNPSHPDRVRILAIQGGALLGLADMEILKELEKRSGKKIHELFDFVAGTSTGAIIATLLLHPNEKSGEPLSAMEVSNKYEELGGKILSAPLHHTILTGDGLFGPRMRNHARILESQDIFNNATFRDLLRPALFPAFSQKEGGLKIFHNWHNDQGNLYLAPLVSAVTSAPTYFPAVQLIGNETEEDYISDAALIMNAPGDIAYLHARSNAPDAKAYIVVSVGTRWDYDLTDYSSVRGGILQWLNPLLGMIFDGEDRVSSLSLERRRLYDSGADVVSYDLGTVVPTDIDGFNASPEDIQIIRRSGQDSMREQSEQIDEIVELLTNPNAKLPKQKAED